MARYDCPRCGGGFQELQTVHKEKSDSGLDDTFDACPWCHLPMTGGYDPGLNAVMNP